MVIFYFTRNYFIHQYFERKVKEMEIKELLRHEPFMDDNWNKIEEFINNPNQYLIPLLKIRVINAMAIFPIVCSSSPDVDLTFIAL